MSTVYSYEASRRNDPMIERAVKALELSMKEMRLEVVAAFPSRKPRRPSHPAVPYLLRSSPPPVLAPWYAPQESFTFSQKVDVGKFGRSVCVYGACYGKCNMTCSTLFHKHYSGCRIYLFLYGRRPFAETR